MRRCLCVTLAVVVLLSVCTLAALVVWWTGRRLNVEEGAPAFHLVVTWSGAGTREWAVAAARACKRAGADACDEGTRAALTRVVSRDELKYSLRSLDTHLPWYAGAVTLLTDGSALPAWLDTGSPRLRVVTQDEIWTEGVARPSYSASALEAHLPHLFPVLNDAPGAPTTEHMVLVDGNHHVLGAWLGPRDFFWGPGAPVVRMYGEVARGWKREGSTYSAALALAASVLEDVDGATVRRQHVLGAPVALLESVLLDACIEWKEMCAATAARQFPARNDLPLVFMHNHLVQFHKQAVKDDRAGPAVFRFLATDVPEQATAKAFAIMDDIGRTPMFTYVGDGGGNVALNTKFVSYMEALFPCPAPWEHEREGREWCRLGVMSAQFVEDVKQLAHHSLVWADDVWNARRNRTLTGSYKGDRAVFTTFFGLGALFLGRSIRQFIDAAVAWWGRARFGRRSGGVGEAGAESVVREVSLPADGVPGGGEKPKAE